MKLIKICIILAVLFCINLNCFGQNNEVNVIISGGQNPEEDYLYRINGISTTEDIGGVEVTSVSSTDPYRRLVFHNFNTFNVTVIFEVEGDDGRKKTGTIVLRPYERKETQDAYYLPVSYVLIARKMST